MDILFGHFPKRSIWNIHTLETSSPPTKLKRLGFWKNLPVLDSKRCSFRFGKLCRRKKGGIVWCTAVQRQRLGVLWPDSNNYAQALGDVAPRPRLSDHARTFPTVLDDTAMQQPAYLFCLYCWAYPDVNKKDHLSLKTCAGPAIRSDNTTRMNIAHASAIWQAEFQVDLGAQPDGRLPVMQCHGARPRRVDCSTLARLEAGHAAPSTLCDELCMPVVTIHGRLELCAGELRMPAPPRRAHVGQIVDMAKSDFP